MDQFVRLPRDERSLYFVQVAERLRLSPQIVEKDFWVCWTLHALFGLPDLGAALIFNGGTSLSKVYQLIERLSEDIDVSIDRASLGFGDNQDTAAAPSAKERGHRSIASRPPVSTP
jgi:predicted nucleotidyltransferase component of viral defense system